MKRLFYILSACALLLGCTSNDDVLEETEPLSVKPYSCDITEEGIEIVYKVVGATKTSVVYKEQLDEEWTPVKTDTVEGMITVHLENLQQRRYYYVTITAQNRKGQSVSDIFFVKYDYETARDTYFSQPFLQWGVPVSGVKTAIADKGGVIDSETTVDGEIHLVYRFTYKELWSEYVFDSEKRLKEVFVYFDKNRVEMDELRKYVSLAFGYLTYGNMHISIDGEKQVCTLMKTAEGTSYTILYEKDDYIVVDYMNAAGVNLTETQYK